ncbi:MAG: hypothetical protein ACXWRZ_18855 [Bdellovibrio sp.]
MGLRTRFTNILILVSLTFFTSWIFPAWAKESDSKGGIPPWMVQVSSTYTCDRSIVKEPCQATMHGVGFLVYVPAKAELQWKEHYVVITDAHLSNGDMVGSLKISYIYKGSWQPLYVATKNNQLMRLSANLDDVDVIEVQKPQNIEKESLFQYNYIVEKPRYSYFWAKEDSAQSYNKVYVAKDAYVIAPPKLSKNPVEFDSFNSAVNFRKGVSSFEFERKSNERIPGLNVGSYGREYITQSQIVGGMSGSPLLKSGQGQVVVLGLAKRYHRYFNRSYFSTYSTLSELFLDFAEKFYFSRESTDSKISTYIRWSFLPAIGTFIKDTESGISEITGSTLNSGELEDLQFGGNHDTANSGGHDTADGGHDTADGGNSQSIPSSLTKEVQAHLRKNPGMTYNHEHIFGFRVHFPKLQNGSETSEEKSINVYGNIDAVKFIYEMRYLIKTEHNSDIQAYSIPPTVDLKELFRLKIKDHPVFKDATSVATELEQEPFYASSATNMNQLIPFSQQKDVERLPMCFINKASLDNLENNQSVEIAIFRPSNFFKYKQGRPKNYFYAIQTPLDLLWKKAYPNGISTQTDPPLIFENKGFFFVNVADPVCSTMACPEFGALGRTPYITYKWQEDSESTLTNCYILENDAFFEQSRMNSLKSEPL